MGFWNGKHEHYWSALTDLNTVKDPQGNRTGALIIQSCSCGAIRQIEYGPGKDPVIRITIPNEETQRSS